MSSLINIDDIPLDQRKKMLQDLNVKTLVKKGKQKYPTSHSFDVYEIINEDSVCVPFAYHFQYLNMGYPNKDILHSKLEATFNISLFDRQKQIRDESLKILNENRSIVLSLNCGWGKTMFAIYLACKINLKTVIFAHRIIIIEQWRYSIIKACGEDVKVQVVTATCAIDPDADFYIINAINVPKRNRMDFSHCGVNIADECLIGESMIVTDIGIRTIEQIHNMDISSRPRALSYNQYTRELEFKQITNSWYKEKKEPILELTFGDQSIKCTGGHKILTIVGYVEDINV